MVQQNLVDYVKQLLQQGYNPETIRTTLLNAGYTPQDVQDALTAAGAKHVNTKMLLMIFGGVLVIAIITLVTLKLLQAPPAELTFALTLFTQQAAPGQELTFTSDIENPSGTSTTGVIDYTITGPPGRVASTTESFTVKEQTNLPTTIRLPKDLQPGTYTLTATLTYGQKQKTQTETFQVTEVTPSTPGVPAETLVEQPVEQAKEAQLTCPATCDDLNFCTHDTCVQGQCVNTQILPCCGDRQCEEGEDCAIDCKQNTPDQLVQQAVTQASTNPNKATETCNTLGQQAYIDRCLDEVSRTGNTKQPCEGIVDDETRDACYIEFAYQNDYTVCEKITNPSTQNSCYGLQELGRVQTEGQG